jgi:hypothetical protein
MKAKKPEASQPKSSPVTPQAEFLFGKINYQLLLVGLAVICIGFLLMAGGGSDDPTVFNDAIFNFRRIRLAPTVVLIGFGLTVFAVLKNPKKS